MTTIVRASPRQSCSCCGTQVLAAVKDVNGTTVLHVQDRRHGTVHLRYFSLPDLEPARPDRDQLHGCLNFPRTSLDFPLATNTAGKSGKSTF